MSYSMVETSFSYFSPYEIIPFNMHNFSLQQLPAKVPQMPHHNGNRPVSYFY